MAQSEAKVRALEIERLELLLAKARRKPFGQSSERGKLLVEQLESAIEDLKETQAKEEARTEIDAPAATEKRVRPARGLASCRTICQWTGCPVRTLCLRQMW